MAKSLIDGAPPDYDHKYDDSNYAGPWEYPIVIEKKWMPRSVKSPYKGVDLIEKYILWTERAADDGEEMEALNQENLLSEAFANLNKSSKKFGYVVFFVLVLFMTENLLFWLPAIYYYYQGSSLFFSFILQAGQATPRGRPSIKLSMHYVYLSLVIIVSLGGVVLSN